jgi:prolyl oligopeptidase
MKKAIKASVACLGLVALGAGPAFPSDPGAPPAETLPVSDTLHGVSVADPYRWLENSADKKVQAWSEAQDQRTRKYLDAIPQRAAIAKRLYQDISATSSTYYGFIAVGEHVFANYYQPPKQQSMIALLTNALDPATARVIVDPNALNPQGTTAIDWFVPSHDGKTLAVSMSENGSEDGTLHLFDVASGKEVGPRIPRVQFPTAGGSLAWGTDNKGFWYTRYPGPERSADERHFFQQIFYHRLGTDPSQDAYVLGKDFPKVGEIQLSNHFDHDLLLVSVENGDGGEYAHYLIDPTGQIRQVTKFSDAVVSATAGADGTLYMVSRQNAPRGKLLKLQPGMTDLSKAEVIVAESDAVIQPGGAVTPTASTLYVAEIIGGPSRVAMFDHAGRSKGDLPLPNVSAVTEIEPLSDGSLLHDVRSYLRPEYIVRYTESNATSVETKLGRVSPVSFADAEVIREMVKSKDGTHVPINIVRRKGTQLNGANPLLLYGYGGFSVSEIPTFLKSFVRIWLDAGGVYVDANLRGGGEFGEEWHSQGALTHKQNVFDDFIAAAEHLIAEKYTDRAHLAILGGSNGGLLMGAVLTQRPELFRAVVSQVGIYDMTRVELDANGAFNITEFGSVRDPQQFKALYDYSPYHHVAKGDAYPAVFMQTGATDGRVNPAHSRKMAAALQSATTSGHPILLSIDSHAGHGIGSSLSSQVNKQADDIAFLFDQLGMKMPQR